MLKDKATIRSISILSMTLFLAGCGGSELDKRDQTPISENLSQTAESDHNDMISIPEGAMVDFGSTIIESDDIRDPRPTLVKYYSRTGKNDKEIFLQFPQNLEECLSAKADVTETVEAVQIRLHTGTANNSSSSDCSKTGTLVGLKIELNLPLGNRSVIQQSK